MTIATSAFCAKQKDENPYDGTEPVLNSHTKKPYDFDGMNVIIADYLSTAKKENTSNSVKFWREWTNNTYNMNVICKQMWGADAMPFLAADLCVNAIDSQNENYVILIDDRIAELGVRANLFYDLAKISTVDYSNADKYDQNVKKKLVRGKSFYAFGWEKNDPLPGVYFNKRILQEKGFSSEYLYDLQLNGRWNWNAFERLCNMITADTDYDGETDVYAMSSDIVDFANLCLDSNDTSVIVRDRDGNYSNNMINTKTMEAFYWMSDIWQKHQLPDKKKEGPDYCYKAFFEGKTAFLVGHQDKKVANKNFSMMNDEYGFVCFPLGPKNKAGYRTITNPRMAVIPSCYSQDRADKIARAVDLWLESPPDKSNNPWKSNYASLFRDTRVIDETLVLMLENPNPRIDVLINKISVAEIYNNILKGINSPEEEYYFTKFGWANVLDDANRFVEKRNKLTDEDFEEEIKEEKRKEKTLSRLQKKIAAKASGETEEKETLTVVMEEENAKDKKSQKKVKKSKKSDK